jgi:hypothetical protein
MESGTNRGRLRRRRHRCCCLAEAGAPDPCSSRVSFPQNVPLSKRWDPAVAGSHLYTAQPVAAISPVRRTHITAGRDIRPKFPARYPLNEQGGPPAIIANGTIYQGDDGVLELTPPNHTSQHDKPLPTRKPPPAAGGLRPRPQRHAAIPAGPGRPLWNRSPNGWQPSSSFPGPFARCGRRGGQAAGHGPDLPEGGPLRRSRAWATSTGDRAAGHHHGRHPARRHPLRSVVAQAPRRRNGHTRAATMAARVCR